MNQPVRDVVIIGSGAGGGPLALTLSRAGLDVLVLEKGPDYRREDYPTDEILSLWGDFFYPALGDEPHMLIHRDLAAPRPTLAGWTPNCVGGGTVHMGASLLRFDPADFELRSRYGNGGSNDSNSRNGNSSDGTELADWPYSYDELEPFYCQAEREVGVSGLAGSNPFEGPRSQGYPMPPVDSHPVARHLEAACAQRGLTAFPTPRGVNSRPYQGRPACSYCQRCSGYGCRTGARGTAQEALIARAWATKNCEVVSGVMVRRVTVDRTGRATGCLYLDAAGNEHAVQARIVCVCCSSVESARLLLLSTSSSFPQGLANSSGRVGRHLQFHGGSIGSGTFDVGRHPDLELDDRHPFLNRTVADYSFLPEHVAAPAKGGVMIFGLSRPEPVSIAKGRVAGIETPWGMALKRSLLGDHRPDRRRVSFEIHHDFLPNRGTFVELDPDVCDRWGLPVARIHLDEPAEMATVGKWLVERGLEILDQLGAETLTSVSEGDSTPYLVHGTCRAGNDPETSVVDGLCQTHEVPNLFVVDGSFMPTSGGAPPTLTILANSFRVADSIARRARAGDFGA
ncbi:MAG: GMC family oxidoreductase [Acidobacteriota bacterium]